MSHAIYFWRSDESCIRSTKCKIDGKKYYDDLSINEKWKCVIFKCYSSEELITLNTLHEVVPTWYSFHSWVDWSNADKVSCSRRKHIDAEVRTRDLCIQNRHSNHYTNCSQENGPSITRVNWLPEWKFLTDMLAETLMDFRGFIMDLALVTQIEDVWCH